MGQTTNRGSPAGHNHHNNHQGGQDCPPGWICSLCGEPGHKPKYCTNPPNPAKAQRRVEEAKLERAKARENRAKELARANALKRGRPDDDDDDTKRPKKEHVYFTSDVYKLGDDGEKEMDWESTVPADEFGMLSLTKTDMEPILPEYAEPFSPFAPELTEENSNELSPTTAARSSRLPYIIVLIFTLFGMLMSAMTPEADLSLAINCALTTLSIAAGVALLVQQAIGHRVSGGSAIAAMQVLLFACVILYPAGTLATDPGKLARTTARFTIEAFTFSALKGNSIDRDATFGWTALARSHSSATRRS
jgi:hypothetical protein